MPNVSFAQPDVTLLLDLEGVIRRATLSSTVADEAVDAWLGRPWVETVSVAGSRSVQQLLDDARRTGVSGFRQVAQRLPSGRELAIEYTTVRLGESAGLLAIGKNLQAVAELQSRLVSAQQAMERDYWKLREVETRYRVLFDAANEAVLVVRAGNLEVVEANPAAMRAIGAAPVGRDLLPELAPADREPFQAMLARVREHGKAPGLIVRLGRDGNRWLVRASQMATELGPVFLIQLGPAGGATTASEWAATVPLGELVERAPDGFLVLDRDGVIIEANRAFLDQAQMAAKASVVGEHARRWLGRPGADMTAILAGIKRRGTVRRFATSLHGELGSELEVEVSAVGSSDTRPRFIGLLVHDLASGARATTPAEADGLAVALGSLTRQVGKTPLLELVRTTVGAVERHYVTAALDLTRGNRTAAAELLGLSRQSLYAKLWRYGLDGSGEAASD
jgi:transcriptional regulator PpsR